MGRRIIPARLAGSTAPDLQQMHYTTGQTFKRGAALTLTSGDLVVATSAITGATLLGFAANDVATNPGYDAANSPTVVTGRMQEVGVYRVSPGQIFSGQFVNNSATPIAPALTDIGVNYGLKDYTGEWFVDKNQTTTDACVTIVDIDIDAKIVYFKVMPARMLAP